MSTVHIKNNLFILYFAFIFTLLFSCRVEGVRTLTGDGVESEALFFNQNDTPKYGRISENVSFAIGIESIEPPQRTSLAGFGGASRRLTPPNISGAGGFFTYCLPYTSVDLAPRAKVLLWQGNSTRPNPALRLEMPFPNPPFEGETGFVTSQNTQPQLQEDSAKSTRQDVFAIIALDVVAVPADVTKRMVATLQDAFPNLDLHQGNIQLVASHTHSGPAGLTQNSFWAAFACDRYSQELWEFFAKQVVAAFQQAINKQYSVGNIGLTSQKLDTFNKSRMPGLLADTRQLLVTFSKEPGQITNSSSGGTSSGANAGDGSIDAGAQDGSTIPNSKVTLGLAGVPCFTTYAVHPTWFGQNQLVLSSDIVGHLEQELKKENSDADCIFLNGAVGNADARAENGLDAYAKSFAKGSKTASKATGKSLSQTLEYGGIIVNLPVPQPNLKACKVPPVDFLVSAKILQNLPNRTKIAYLLVGDTLFLFYPGEPIFTVQQELEVEVKKIRRDIATVQVLAVSNDYLGYLVNEENFDNETLESCSTLYGRRITNALLEATLTMLSGGF